MPFKLLKTRINTHYQQAIAPFKNAKQFQDWLNDTSVQSVETVQGLQDNNLESAHAIYAVQFNDQRYQLDVRIVQSTQLTIYCFDVFIMLKTTSADKLEQALYHTINSRLEQLRRKYNGNWVIGDDDLTLSVLQ